MSSYEEGGWETDLINVYIQLEKLYIEHQRNNIIIPHPLTIHIYTQ